MNNTRAALPRTHAVSPASTCMRRRMARSCYRTVAEHVSGVLRTRLDGVRAPLPRPHADQLLDGGRPHFTVADLPGRRGLGDDLHHVVRVVAAWRKTSTTCCASSSATMTSRRTFGTKSTVYSAPRYSSM